MKSNTYFSILRLTIFPMQWWIIMCILFGAFPAHAALVTHFSQSTYDVDVDPTSDLFGNHPYSGLGVTDYATLAGTTGTQVILQAFPGQFNPLTQNLILHFSAHAGHQFTTVDFSHLLTAWWVQGGYSASMSWQMTPQDGVTQTGSSPTLSNAVWFSNTTYSDFTQASSLMNVNAPAFDLLVALNYSASGFAGGCSSATGVCVEIASTRLKVFASTVPVAVPLPSTLFLFTSSLTLIGAVCSNRVNPKRPIL